MLFSITLKHIDKCDKIGRRIIKRGEIYAGYSDHYTDDDSLFIL